MGADPRPFLQHREFRYERTGVNAHAIGQRNVMLDDRMATDAHVVADGVLLTHQRAVAGGEPRSDAIARVNHRVRTQQRIRADDRGKLAFAAARGLDTHDAVVADDSSRPHFHAEVEFIVEPIRIHGHSTVQKPGAVAMEETHQPFSGKIGIIGAGALGGYYGARLCQAGFNVHFLMRSDYDAVRRQGLEVRSIDGDFMVHPPVYKSAEEMGVCDLLIIALKTTDNAVLPDLLAATADEKTVVLSLQNGLGNDEALARILAGHSLDATDPPARLLPTASQVMGGPAFLCSTRVAPGVIDHSEYGFIRLAEFAGASTPRTHAVAAMFRAAGVPCDVLERLDEARWGKLIWNVPFNGLGVASPGADSAVILADPVLLRVARELMDEVIAAARADGVELDESLAEQSMARTHTMGAYKSSMQVDYELGRPLEVEAILGEPVRRARRAGIAVPAMELLYGLVRRADEKLRAKK